MLQEKSLVQKLGSANLSIKEGCWTRTSGDRSRGIYSPLQLPLCDTPLRSRICWRKELNPQPSDYKSGALPIELHQHTIILNSYSATFPIYRDALPIELHQQNYHKLYFQFRAHKTNIFCPTIQEISRALKFFL